DSPSPLSGTHSKLAFDRLLYFSDAVFAIAITLLALELRLPEDVAGGGDALWHALGAMWPKYLSFLVSFMVIGLYWQGHHRMFRLINRFDDRLLWINLLFLMCIVVIPFPTSVLGEHANQPAAVVFYACVLALTGLLQLAMWLYATFARRLVEVSLDDRQYRFLQRLVGARMAIPPLVFLLSVAVARYSPTWVEYSWILIAPALALVSRIGRSAASN
ncbi:MAG: TMEM175 family protein, partial [Burkholderiales bacterium]